MHPGNVHTTRARTRHVAWIILTVTATLAAMTVRSAASQPATRPEQLRALSTVYHETLMTRRPPAYYRMLQSSDPATRALNAEPALRLMYFDERGLPTYYITHNSLAADFIRTDNVWPGGMAGLSLSGNATVAGQLAVWDAGAVRVTHQEFGGRVAQMDTAVTTHPHSTHVAGTLVAAGVQPAAKGMSYEAPLHAYEWDDDLAEMAAAAATGLRVSNHSYGLALGWYRDSGGNWYWFGDTTVSTDEDYRFGFYNQDAHDLDEIAYNAPYYTIVASAGNDREDNGPAAGTEHYHVDHNTWTVSTSTDTHPDDGAGPNGEDTVGPGKTAKNVITVGSGQYVIGLSGLKASNFSSAGPTDDGRVKPDIVADGNYLYSTIDDSDTAYDSYQGTSMASPGVAGSINLLIEHYETHYGKPPLSSTMKAVLLHCAETENVIVPSSTVGWGKMDTQATAALISAAPQGDGVMEATLQDGETHRYYFTPVTSQWSLTLVWTDPPAVVSAESVDPPDSKLVNDLDVRMVTSSGDTVKPVVVDWSTPPPRTVYAGDNTSDNVERIQGYYVVGTCEVLVSHKGTLQNGQQSYSLVWSKLTPHQPLPPAAGPSSLATVDLGYPGAAPDEATSENEERGIFFTAIKRFDLDAVGFKVAIPCENTLTAKLYAMDGGYRGGLLASGTVVSHAAGDVVHYVPLNYTLEPCQDYELTIEYEETIRWWMWHKGMIDLPYDAGGVVRVTGSQWNGSTSTPVLAQFALAGRALGDVTVTDLEPHGITWDTSTDAPGDRGVFVTAGQTASVSALKWGASVPAFSSHPIEASIYEADGTTRGALVAHTSTAVLNLMGSGTKQFSIPINATLVEGRDYNLSVTFDPTSFQMTHEDDVAFPYSVDGLLTVVDGEAGGDAADTLLTHFGVNWTAGAGGTPHDLAKAGSPSYASSTTGDPGALVTSLIDQQIYSIGWMADVPAGATLGVRLYEFYSFYTAPTLIAESEIASAAAGMRWHDIPVGATLTAGQDYIIEMVPSTVNSWEYWNDGSGTPYQPYGVVEVAEAVLDRLAAGDQLPHLRLNLCNTTLTGVDDNPATPPSFSLSAPYPNPASNRATVEYHLDTASRVWMNVYDVAGRRVATVLGGKHQPAGPGTAYLDTSTLPTGIYFMVLRSPRHHVARKITIVK